MSDTGQLLCDSIPEPYWPDPDDCFIIRDAVGNVHDVLLAFQIETDMDTRRPHIWSITTRRQFPVGNHYMTDDEFIAVALKEGLITADQAKAKARRQ